MPYANLKPANLNPTGGERNPLTKQRSERQRSQLTYTPRTQPRNQPVIRAPSLLDEPPSGVDCEVFVGGSNSASGDDELARVGWGTAMRAMSRGDAVM